MAVYGKERQMKYKDMMRYIKKHPNKDLNGKSIAYDIDGKPLGEIMYTDGRVISMKKYGRKPIIRKGEPRGNPFKWE